MWTWSGVVLPIFTMASVMAAVISRFCWSVRPAYHWIVMFGMARLLGVDRVGCGRGYRRAPSVGQGAGLRPALPGTTATFARLTPAKPPDTGRAGRPVEFRVDRRRGSALVAEGQVVHVAIL